MDRFISALFGVFAIVAVLGAASCGQRAQCLAAPVCGPGSQQVDECPEGEECQEVTTCGSTITCMETSDAGGGDTGNGDTGDGDTGTGDTGMGDGQSG